MRLILLVFLYGSRCLTLSGAEIKGVVKEKGSGVNLPGVTVYIPDLNMGVVTDGQGFYQIKEIRPGNYRVQFSSVGFSTLIKSVLLRDSIVLNIELERTAYSFNEVVVSDGKARSIEETPYKIETIQVKELAKAGNISLMDALTVIPGIDQISYGAAIGKPVIRGLSFSRIMTVYQGVRFENQQWGEEHGLGLNDLGAERIEVIKGPASLIYGSGAIGGVINIIDENIPEAGKLKGEFSQNFHSNTLGYRTAGGAKGTTRNGLFGSFRFLRESHADYIDGRGVTVGNSRFSMNSAKISTGLIKSWGIMKLSYTYNDQILGIIEEDENENTLATSRNDRSIQLPYQRVKDHFFSLQNTFFIGISKVKLNISYHYNDRKEIEEDLNEVDLGINLHTTNYDLKYLRPLTDKIELTIGMQGFFQSNFNQTDVNDILIPDSRLFDNSFFSMTDINLGKVHLQGGVRYDRRHTTANSERLEGYILPGSASGFEVSRNFSGFSGSAGATFKFNKAVLVKANVASGFRAPDLAELFANGEHPGTNRFESGNPEFGREQNLEVDLSTSIRLKNFSIEVSGFHNNISNYIFFDPTTEVLNGLTIWRYTQDDALLYGGESGIVLHPSFLQTIRVQSNVSVVNGTRKSDDSPLPLIPPVKFKHTLTYSPKMDFGRVSKTYIVLNVINAMAQERVSEGEHVTPAYNLVGIGIGATVPIGKSNIDFSVKGNNLFNENYFDHLAITRPFGIYNMGRNISLNLRWEI
jgi:iron complex outermembrane recepter protein